VEKDRLGAKSPAVKWPKFVVKRPASLSRSIPDFAQAWMIVALLNAARRAAKYSLTTSLTLIDIPVCSKMASHRLIQCFLRGPKPPTSHILLVVSEKLDELFHFLVDSFSLTVGLQMVHCGGGWLDTDKAPEFSGELRNELGAAVGNVLIRCAVEFPDIPVVQLRGTDRIEPGGALNEVGALTQDIDYNHD
jgi:hypothetical protein